MELFTRGAGAKFDWTLFDNWNQRKVVWQPSKVLMFGLDYVWREAAIIEHEINHIKKIYYVWLILILTE
jgi:hypothetical protein